MTSGRAPDIETGPTRGVIRSSAGTFARNIQTTRGLQRVRAIIDDPEYSFAIGASCFIAELENGILLAVPPGLFSDTSDEFRCTIPPGVL